jgi:hypothetical protein
VWIHDLLADLLEHAVSPHVVASYFDLKNES